jgi:hypothetical protein
VAIFRRVAHEQPHTAIDKRNAGIPAGRLYIKLFSQEWFMSNRTLPLMKKHVYTIFPLRLCVKLFSQEIIQ